ncbi:LacI family DNA-binding transcriptional regulator [Lachnospiraceae bacterium HCP28S3_F9]
MGGSVRLSDIALKLNVSMVTVSKAISGQKGVSEEIFKYVKN